MEPGSAVAPPCDSHRLELTHSTVCFTRGTRGHRPRSAGPSTHSAYLFMIRFPTSVEPVNAIFRTSGWSESLWPTTEPGGGVGGG